MASWDRSLEHRALNKVCMIMAKWGFNLDLRSESPLLDREQLVCSLPHHTKVVDCDRDRGSKWVGVHS